VLGASPTIHDVAADVSGLTVDEVIESIMTVDTESYLPDDILVKVDRASMACSLEARAPLLDHRLFELVRSMPLQFQLQGTRGKLLLRSVLNEFVPESLIDRPKTGFGIPIDSWLRGPLRDWAEELMNPARLSSEGFFNVASVRDVWEQHLRGSRQGHYLIWDVLMFQSWLDHQKTGPVKTGPASLA
jgi:asparagine synthase (glutamine-hydrolysing)